MNQRFPSPSHLTTMLGKSIAIILSVAVFAVVGLPQSTYSESSYYEPKIPSRSKNKKDSDVPVSSQKDVVVTIPMSVFDKNGVPVANLTKAEVTVNVDGEATPILTFEKAAAVPSIVLLLDMSPSAHRRIENIRDQARNVVQSLPAETKVMVADFHSQMNIRSAMTADRKEIEKAISSTKVGDGTSLYTAVKTLFDQVLPTIDGRKIVIIFSDGVDTTSTSSTYASSLERVESSDVSIYTVFYDTLADIPQGGATGVPRYGRPGGILMPLPPLRGGLRTGSTEAEYEKGREYMSTLAAASSGRMFQSKKFPEDISSLIAELSAKYYISVSAPATSGNGRVKIRINRSDLKIRSRGKIGRD